MHVTIGCIDGNTYSGDDFPESEVQDELDAANGVIGSGGLSDLTVHTVDELAALTSKMLSGDEINGYEFETVTIIINGQDRVFKTKDIVWHEIHRDKIDA